MILASRRSERTNLAHYWRRIARQRSTENSHKKSTKTKCALNGDALRLCLFVVIARRGFYEIRGSGASGHAEGFGEVAAAEIADARADLCYGEIGFCE